MVVAPLPLVPVEVTHRVGLAAVAAVRRFVDPEVAVAVGLKWPNDVLIGDRKLAGILAQRVPGRDSVVVGLGLNVGWAPDGAVSVAQVATAATVTPALLLHAVLQEFDALSDDVARRYRDALFTIGRSVRVELPGAAEALEGQAIDVDESGRLVVVDAAGQRHELDVGDVVHVRDASA